MQARPWTTTELKKASELWKASKDADEIANALGRTSESVKHKIRLDRDLFPRRYNARSEIRTDGEGVAMKFTVTPFLHKTIKAEAKRKGVSQTMLVREALRNVFLRRKQA